MDKTKLSLNYMAAINSLGYGIASKNILYKLDSQLSLTYFPIGRPEEYDPNKQEIIKRTANKQMQVCKADYGLKVWHEFALAERPPCNKFIGFPIFEIDILPQQSVYNIASCDHIFVASEWAKQVVIDSFKEYQMDIPNPKDKAFITVVPLAVDLDVFTAREPVQNKTCKFFNCGKWEVRKGHDILLKAFQQAFPNHVDVSLHMMCDNMFPQARKFTQSIEELYNSDHRVNLIPRVSTSEEVAAIMSTMDCGVFPSRAEGWNLELLEMMAMNKQVIATNYSAHTEFCNNSNTKLLEINELDLAYDGIWFDGSKKWAKIDEPEIRQLSRLMKEVYLDWKKNKVLTNPEGLKTAQKYSWDNTCNKIMTFLGE